MARKLKRIMIEINELLGLISIEELISNNRISQRYQEMYLEFLRTC